jgi:hypothetical protein
VSDRLSPINQRVRRLLGTGSLNHADFSDQVQPPAPPSRGDTGTLFEARIAKLSHVLDELRAVDMQREYELRALREQLLIAHERARRELCAALAPALTEIDVLLHRGKALLAPPEEPPATPFDRMRARRASQHSEARQREQLAALVAHLAAVRAQLAALAEE